MDGWTLIREVVSDADDGIVAPIGDDGRSGDGAVEGLIDPLVAIRGAGLALRGQSGPAGDSGVRSGGTIICDNGNSALASPGGGRAGLTGGKLGCDA